MSRAEARPRGERKGLRRGRRPPERGARGRSAACRQAGPPGRKERPVRCPRIGAGRFSPASRRPTPPAESFRPFGTSRAAEKRGLARVSHKVREIRDPKSETIWRLKAPILQATASRGPAHTVLPVSATGISCFEPVSDFELQISGLLRFSPGTGERWRLGAASGGWGWCFALAGRSVGAGRGGARQRGAGMGLGEGVRGVSGGVGRSWGALGEEALEDALEVVAGEEVDDDAAGLVVDVGEDGDSCG